MKERIFVLGVPFDPVTKTEVLEAMENAAAGKKQVFITTPNPEICMAAQNDAEFLHILQSADISFADGIGILWATNQLQITNPSIIDKKSIEEKYSTTKKKSLLLSLITFARNRKSKYLPEQVCGSDVFREFCQSTKHPVFLLGGARGAAKKCQEIFNHFSQDTPLSSNSPTTKQKKDFPIVDVDDGSSAPEDEDRIVQKINESGARVLFVAFGAPTQEKWIARNRKKLPHVRVLVGVGGSFDFIAGMQKRAPKLFRALGLEWLWRLLMEPKKRGKRIFTAVWRFPRKVWKG